VADVDLWLSAAHHEHDLWRKLCTRLVLERAVTKEDLECKAGADDTTGCRLINLIREWGESRATLALAHAAAKKENPDDDE
jgi:hypothetical protein